ncbi:MAG TPA: hypothetical protein VGQ46_09405 [Thermoanaerobaculia bacterium]|jgi:hypothetical protein|nr:hypothetical protein [Thermoanaerobaculia bacterium]
MTTDEFHTRVNDAVHSILRRAITAKALDIRPKVVTLGQEVSRPFNLKLPLRRDEQYVQRLNAITSEVVDSHAAMRNVELYLSRFAFAEDGVRPSAYIRYHVESFLNEMYILRERMDAFAVKIGKEFRKDRYLTNGPQKIAYIRSEVKRLFDPAIRMRGGHVHEARHDDAELAQLVLWETLATIKPAEFHSQLTESAEAVRASNLEFVKSVNSGLAEKLDRFFTYFEGLIFEKDGSLRYPTNISVA